MAKKTLTAVKVDFTGGGDGVTALYIDGKLQQYGDYYHNKINETIDGFIEGLKFAGIKVDFSNKYCQDKEMIENVSEIGDVPPKYIDDIELGDDRPEEDDDEEYEDWDDDDLDGDEDFDEDDEDDEFIDEDALDVY